MFRWDGGGNEIYVCGTFNDWETKIPMTNRYAAAVLSLSLCVCVCVCVYARNICACVVLVWPARPMPHCPIHYAQFEPIIWRGVQGPD